MALPSIAPPAGLTNADVVKFVFDGPRWQAEAAKAFGVRPRQVRRLIHDGRLTAKHYLIMDDALRRREQVTPLIVLQDERRARERGKRRLAQIAQARARIIAPFLARFRAA